MRSADIARLVRLSLAAAASGVIATLPMSAVMLVAGAAGLLGTSPPRRVVDKAVKELPGPDPSPRARKALAAGLHLAAGGAMAVGIVPLLVALRGFGPRLRRHLAAGAAFGTSLYALNYAGLAPALGVLPPPTRDRPGRQPTMLAAHLVYGIVLAALLDAVEPGVDARPRTRRDLPRR